MIRAKIIFCSQRKKDFLNHFYGSILLFLTLADPYGFRVLDGHIYSLL